MYSSPIIPAIIPVSATDVVEQMKQLVMIPEVHVDVTDGIFVSGVSWPYGVLDAKSSPSSLRYLFDTVTLEVDLMVQNPQKAAHDWIEAGADLLVFHVETITLEAFSAFVSASSVTIGVAANNDTSYEQLRPYLSVAEYVQVMGIATIGSQGQPFDVRALERIEDIKKDFPALPISIDGSVNEQTLPELHKHNLHRYIVGSAIIGNHDPIAAYKNLTTLVM